MRKYSGFGDRLLMIFIYASLVVILILVVAPVLNVLANSFSAPSAVVAGKVSFWPVEFSLQGYQAVLRNSLIMTGFLNSVIYTLFGTMLNLTLTFLLAYPLAMDGFYGKKVFLGYFIVTMFFSGGMVPSYLLMKDLHLLDTRLSMIVTAGVSVYNTIIARTYMRTTIDPDLYGAAAIDGAGDGTIFLRIVLPLSKPIIAVFTMMFAVGHWNSFFGGLMYLRNRDYFPLQLVLRQILDCMAFVDIPNCNARSACV